MGSSVSITSLKVAPNLADQNEKYMFINFNYPEYNKLVSFYEEMKNYNNDTLTEITPRFCLTDDLSIDYCGSFISPTIAEKYILVKGNECRSFNFRPGSMIIFKDEITKDYIDTKLPAITHKFISKGYQCKFLKKDFIIDDSSLVSCCTNLTNTQKCPSVLNNGYETSHCDLIMSNFCKRNPDSFQCLKWLRKKRKIALQTYSEICSDHMDQRFCSEFIRVVRPEFYTFGDTALINFCKKHTANRNCWCVFPPNNTLQQRFLGPKVCWLHECTDKTRDRKWLLFDQDVQRSRCKYTGCTININSLTMENSKADLIANCYNNNSVIGDIDPGKPKKNNHNKQNFPFIFWYGIITFVSLFILFYFIVIYSKKKIKTRDINVRRR
ncbi:108L protein [Yaba-like disease virus]|uniref:108L protein n=1 Tax=Yaba-like disease virus TaxID=132475 RepID=Q9DHK5_YLDV|nr:108L protein [Yaba-like disease virus]CAC21346.1 108L protein [Yaba-like disease virus]